MDIIRNEPKEENIIESEKKRERESELALVNDGSHHYGAIVQYSAADARFFFRAEGVLFAFVTPKITRISLYRAEDYNTR
jgi:hypothetical protein